MRTTPGSKGENDCGYHARGAGRPPNGRPACSFERDGTSPPGGANRIVAHDPCRLRDIPVPAPNQEPPALGPVLAEVTNAVVRLHSAHYGKGPTRSKSFLLGDVLICVMRDVFTTVERTLVEAGEQAMVRETRLAWQDAMRDRFIEAVEQIVGRRVLGLTSQVLTEQDVAIEVFLLEARSSEPAA
jgi:uncharacterized protein YbcI